MSKHSYKIKDIANIIKAKALLINKDDSIQNLLFDSRKIDNPSLSLFFALKSNRDGHDFLDDAYTHGIRNFVVEKNRVHFFNFPNANFLEVEDVLLSLQTLAAYHRAQFNYPVIAIAGSNGKTIVKDWLYQLLSPDFAIVRSPKSFNSQIGVALSLWQMSDDYNLALIEAGISKPHEMEALQKMINPEIGVLTNIKKAHFENFESKEEKILEKMKLFKNADIFILPSFTEAFPLVLLEAMQFELPVISTCVGGIPEMIIDNESGLLAEPDNAQMLAEKISILLNDKVLRCELGKNGYERFKNNYTLRHYEKNIHNVFNDILNTPSLLN